MPLTKTFARDPREAEIKRLDNLERESVMRSDSVALYERLWSPAMIINTPANVVGTVKETKALFRSGNLSYKSFERTIERVVSIHDNVAIVMGAEVIKPQGKQLHAGKTVTRRFTNVWMYKNNAWSIARQATIIKIE